MHFLIMFKGNSNHPKKTFCIEKMVIDSHGWPLLGIALFYGQPQP